MKDILGGRKSKNDVGGMHRFLRGLCVHVFAHVHNQM